MSSEWTSELSDDAGPMNHGKVGKSCSNVRGSHYALPEFSLTGLELQGPLFKREPLPCLYPRITANSLSLSPLRF